MDPTLVEPLVKMEPEEKAGQDLLSLPTLKFGGSEDEPMEMDSQQMGGAPALQARHSEGTISATAAESPGVAEVEQQLSQEMHSLNLKEAGLDAGDVRRDQLSSRAVKLAEREEQKKRKELEKEAAKEEKAQAKAKAKSKGRPRKSQQRDGVKEAEQQDEACVEDAKPKRRKVEPSEPAKGEKRSRKPSPEAKKKAATAVHKRRKTSASKVTPEAQEVEVVVDEVRKLEMRALLLKWKDHAYDKSVETLHKGKFKESQIVVYWTRDATGVKVQKDGKWCQVSYFAKFAHMILAIYAASQMAEQLDKHGPAWLDTPAGENFDKSLRATALAAAADDWWWSLQKL